MSSYHAFYKEAHGEESKPTFYFRWKQLHPYHVDYCFVPKGWEPRVHGIEVGSYETWKSPLRANIAETNSLALITE